MGELVGANPLKNPLPSSKVVTNRISRRRVVLTTDTANNIQRTTNHWYVAHCQRLKEWQAAAALEEHLELAVYLPEVRRRGSRQVRRSPFFPGYLFVRADLRQVARLPAGRNPAAQRWPAACFGSDLCWADRSERTCPGLDRISGQPSKDGCRCQLAGARRRCPSALARTAHPWQRTADQSARLTLLLMRSLTCQNDISF